MTKLKQLKEQLIQM